MGMLRDCCASSSFIGWKEAQVAVAVASLSESFRRSGQIFVLALVMEILTSNWQMYDNDEHATEPESVKRKLFLKMILTSSDEGFGVAVVSFPWKYWRCLVQPNPSEESNFAS